MEAPPIFALGASQAGTSNAKRLSLRWCAYRSRTRKKYRIGLRVMFDSGFARTRRFRWIGIAVNGTQSDDSFLLCW